MYIPHILTKLLYRKGCFALLTDVSCGLRVNGYESQCNHQSYESGQPVYLHWSVASTCVRMIVIANKRIITNAAPTIRTFNGILNKENMPVRHVQGIEMSLK